MSPQSIRRRLFTMSLLGGLAAGPAFGQAGPMPVTVAKPVSRGVSETADFTGRFQASAAVQVTSRVTGYLESARFHEGGSVKAGDVLFTIDPRPFQASVDQATAQVQVAQTKLDLARTNLNRSQELRRSGNVTDALFQANQQAFFEGQATLDAANAALAAARLDLDYSTIKAPISGRIGRKLVTEGNLVVANSVSPLCTIVAVDPVYFYFDVDEATYLAYERENGRLGEQAGDALRRAEVALPDETGFPHPARLDYVDPQVDAGTGTVTMRATLDNPDGFLTPGLFGRIRVTLSAPYEGLVLPDAAILRSGQGSFVMVVSSDGAAAMRPVQVGPKFGEFRVVKSGVSASDAVIVEGLMRARPGGKVIPQPTELKVPEDLASGEAARGASQ